MLATHSTPYKCASDLVDVVAAEVLRFSVDYEIAIALRIHAGELKAEDADLPACVDLSSNMGTACFMFDVRGDAWLMCCPRVGQSSLRRVTISDRPAALISACMRTLAGHEKSLSDRKEPVN